MNYQSVGNAHQRIMVLNYKALWSGPLKLVGLGCGIKKTHAPSRALEIKFRTANRMIERYW